MYFQGGKGGAMVMGDKSITINEYNLNHQKKKILSNLYFCLPSSLVENLLITLSMG